MKIPLETASVAAINAYSILGIMPTPTTTASLAFKPPNFAPILQPINLPSIAKGMKKAARIPISFIMDRSIIAPTQTKNKGMKNIPPIVFTSSIIFFEWIVVPTAKPAR